MKNSPIVLTAISFIILGIGILLNFYDGSLPKEVRMFIPLMLFLLLIGLTNKSKT